MPIRRLAIVLASALAACSSAPPAPPAAPPPYTLQAFSQTRIVSDSSQPNFQKVRAGVDFHDGPFASARLIVDLGTTCFPFSGWTSDPPPSGQDWPADCDAFDRNFEITLDEPSDPSGPPAVELMRAITPFGGPEHLEIDITDVANGLPGPHTLQVFIPTYSDPAGKVTGSSGGWTVSARLEMTPGTPPEKVLAVVPLLNLDHTSTTTPPVASFTVPPGTTSTRIEYRVTGHGGANDPSILCSGPAEEFCQRTHHLLLDGTELAPGLTPWRSDCASLCTVMHYTPASGGAGFDYCAENPCGAIASVQASRANWCPGSLTPPFTFSPTLPPGTHQLTYAIDGVVPGGSWRVSAVFFAFGS